MWFRTPQSLPSAILISLLFTYPYLFVVWSRSYPSFRRSLYFFFLFFLFFFSNSLCVFFDCPRFRLTLWILSWVIRLTFLLIYFCLSNQPLHKPLVFIFYKQTTNIIPPPPPMPNSRLNFLPTKNLFLIGTSFLVNFPTPLFF